MAEYLTNGCAEVAEVAGLAISEAAPDGAGFSFCDWNDLGEITVHLRGRVYRLTIADITDEAEAECADRETNQSPTTPSVGSVGQ